MVGVGIAPAGAAALILPPATIDGPSQDILELGGAAVAPDGTGGIVYTKAVGGVAHLFVSTFDGTAWGTPTRVDWGQQFAASQPSIAAERNGRLAVVWVTPVATVGGKIRYGLESAMLGPRASGFGTSLLVDPNVGEGIGVDPDIAGASAGKAIVAYRAITQQANEEKLGSALHRFRPGDVIADIRVARFSGNRWSRLGAVNRNPVNSMRPPTVANAPQIGIGAKGNSVVAWQEPDQSGVSRIWVRRIYGSTPGPFMLASPAIWEGVPVGGEASTFSLSVTGYEQARIVSEVEGKEAGPLSGPRLFLASLGPSYEEGSGKVVGPVLADQAGASPPPAPLGPPSVAAGGLEGGKGKMRLAFTTAGQLRMVGVDNAGNLVSLPAPSGAPAIPGGSSFSSISSERGGVVAYEATEPLGQPGVAVRQELASGAAQVGFVSAEFTGPVADLRGGGSEAGNAVLGFLQGEPGNYEVVADAVGSPPAQFDLTPPKGWVRPKKAVVRWAAAPTSVGNVSYSFVLDGHVVTSGLTRQSFKPRPALLGNGIRDAQVIATDGLGGQILSKVAKLKVDSEAPTANLRQKGERVKITVRDEESGVRVVRCGFGDGTPPVRRHGGCAHRYRRPGRFRIAVFTRDRAGNSAWHRFKVTVK